MCYIEDNSSYSGKFVCFFFFFFFWIVVGRNLKSLARGELKGEKLASVWSLLSPHSLLSKYHLCISSVKDSLVLTVMICSFREKDGVALGFWTLWIYTFMSMLKSCLGFSMLWAQQSCCFLPFNIILGIRFTSRLNWISCFLCPIFSSLLVCYLIFVALWETVGSKHIFWDCAHLQVFILTFA